MQKLTPIFFPLLVLFLFLLSSQIFSQPLIWRAIPTIAPHPTSSQMQDVYFINPMTGWTTGLGIYKTTNGGISWETQSSVTTGGIGARSIGFFDPLNGIVGQYRKEAGLQSFLYRTTNGGTNWLPITDVPGINIDSTGACGISIVNSQVAYVVGRYGEPAMVLKTTNAGVNWIRMNVNNLANGLIATHFFSEDTGYVVGNTGVNPNGFDYKPVILYTVNGGNNWSVVYNENLQRKFCWKIFFLTRQIGYVSIYNIFNAPFRYLKTTNGGLNWNEFDSPAHSDEGIGFINENTGWIGGDNYPSFITYKTTNAGVNWFSDNVLSHINKMIFLSDTLGYCVGQTVYKYSRDSISSVKNISNEIPERHYMSQNFPNPFNPSTKIRFYLSTAHSKKVELTVYDNAGKKLETLVNEELIPGGYQVEWNAADYPSGIYFYKLTIENYTETRKMALVK